ncbi:hypothetical protein NO348_17070 [Hungatella hathewayi]|uniref:hypothetical protein n=1 Tax=Hungatella hathewayi TaxID=154046 RepID=UPI00210D4BCE|nr:hypothetical protein [Hungatella hathewayi]MCQ5386536.1 hypothetical protein [Hungatella hathewayi]
MNSKELKRKIKSIPLIGNTYNFFYGDRKAKRIVEQRKKSLQKEGFSIIRSIENALYNCSVQYFMDYGSLLGMIRDGKFMSYDSDIDYGIYVSDSFTWYDLENKLKIAGFKKIRYYTYKGNITEQTYLKNGITVDFFMHFDEQNYSKSYVHFAPKGYHYKNLDMKSIAELRAYKFDGIQKLTISGLTFTAPIEPERYLASIYTENWRYPDPNWISENGPAWNVLTGEVSRAYTEV